MTSDEAKFILSAAQLDELDASDTETAEAIALTQRDPELKAWYEDLRQFDDAVRQQLLTVEPPAELQSEILAGIRVTRQRIWRRRPILSSLLGVAAAAMICVVGWLLLSTSSTGDADDLRLAMLSEIESLDRLDHVSDDPRELTEWLNRNHVPVEFNIPDQAGDRKLAGCKILSWRRSRATLICFESAADRGAAGFHLVVVEAKTMSDLADGELRLLPDDDWSTAAWREGDLVYFIAARGHHGDPRKFISIS